MTTLEQMTSTDIQQQVLLALNNALSQSGQQLNVVDLTGTIRQHQGTLVEPLKGSTLGDLVMRAASASGVSAHGDAAQTLQTHLDQLIAASSEVVAEVKNTVMQNNPDLAGDALAQKIAEASVAALEQDDTVQEKLRFANQLTATLGQNGIITAIVPALKNMEPITVSQLYEPLHAQLVTLAPQERGASQSQQTTDTPSQQENPQADASSPSEQTPPANENESVEQEEQSTTPSTQNQAPQTPAPTPPPTTPPATNTANTQPEEQQGFLGQIFGGIGQFIQMIIGGIMSLLGIGGQSEPETTEVTNNAPQAPAPQPRTTEVSHTVSPSPTPDLSPQTTELTVRP